MKEKRKNPKSHILKSEKYQNFKIFEMKKPKSQIPKSDKYQNFKQLKKKNTQISKSEKCPNLNS